MTGLADHLGNSFANGELGYKSSNRVRLRLEGFNSFDAGVSDIDCFFQLRLRDEPAPVEHIHRVTCRSRSRAAGRTDSRAPFFQATLVQLVANPSLEFITQGSDDEGLEPCSTFRPGRPRNP